MPKTQPRRPIRHCSAPSYAQGISSVQANGAAFNPPDEQCQALEQHIQRQGCVARLGPRQKDGGTCQRPRHKGTPRPCPAAGQGGAGQDKRAQDSDEGTDAAAAAAACRAGAAARRAGPNKHGEAHFACRGGTRGAVHTAWPPWPPNCAGRQRVCNRAPNLVWKGAELCVAGHHNTVCDTYCVILCDRAPVGAAQRGQQLVSEHIHPGEGP